MWIRERIALDEFAGQDVKIRFEFETRDAFFNRYRGWYIDDIEVQ